MKKLILLLFPAFILYGCNSTPNLYTVQYKVVAPPESMYVCPIETKFPNWRTLNDVQVARTIVKLYKNNIRCKASLNAIHEFIDKAQAKIEPAKSEDGSFWPF